MQNIKQDYLTEAETLRPFYAYSHYSPDFEYIIQNREAYPFHRETLVRALKTQYLTTAGSEKALANIEALSQPETFTITTGHQLNLMGGPLFFLYKIISTIRLAAHLKNSLPDYNFVPVYWMATEDHDFEEINHFFMDFEQALRYDGTFTGAVGRHVLDSQITGVLPESIPEALRQAYQPGKKLADAQRELVHTLFGEYGLVILDGDDPALKGLFRETMIQEILHTKISNAIATTNQALEAAEYPLQVHMREINFFYLDDQGRRRISRNEDGTLTDEGVHQWTDTEIEQEIRQNPERFSPNALLRPVYQETILPNLAYFGGWGEISYWMQLKAAFNEARVHYPLLLPRMSVTLIRAGLASEWRQLGFRLEHLEQESHVLNEKYIRKIWSDSDFVARKEKLDQAFRSLEEYVKGEDQSLSTMVAAEHAKMDKHLEKLLKKLKRSIRNRNPKPFQQIADIKNQVSPDGKVQERILNFNAFEIPFQELISLLYEQCDPLRKERVRLELPDISE